MIELIEYFGGLDPRPSNRRHQFVDIMTIALCTLICGGEGWEDMELMGESKKDFFRGFLVLPHGMPSSDTLRRVFGMLEPEAFHTAFVAWMATLYSLKGKHLALDGKNTAQIL